MRGESFRIICDHLQTEEIFDFEICLFGMDFSKIRDSLDSIVNLKKKGLLIKTLVLDVFHYFSDEELFKDLINDYSDLCLISPEEIHLVGSINAFLNYSQADYLFFLNSGFSIEHFEWKNILNAFREDKHLIGLVPAIKTKDGVLDSLYAVNNAETFDIYRKDFKEGGKTLLPHEWTWLIDRKRCLLFGLLDSHYRYFFSSSFDLGYIFLSHAYVIGASKDFLLSFREPIAMENMDIELFQQDRFFFAIKNLKKINFRYYVNKMGFSTFFSFFFLKIFLFTRFYLSRKGKMNDILTYTDEDIVEVLDQ